MDEAEEMRGGARARKGRAPAKPRGNEQRTRWVAAAILVMVLAAIAPALLAGPASGEVSSSDGGLTVTLKTSSPAITNGEEAVWTILVKDTVPMSTSNTSHYLDGVLIENEANNYLNGRISVTIEERDRDLREGVNVYYFTAKDTAGHSVTVSHTVICDRTPPAVTIASPREGVYSNTSSLTWTADDDRGIAFTEFSTDGETWTPVSGNSYPLSSLTDGPYTAYVKVTDLAGNVNQTQMAFVLDKTAPTATVTPSGSGIPIKTAISVSFSEAMNRSSVVMTVNGEEVVLAWSGNNSMFAPSSALAYNARYTVAVTGKDIAGNSLTGTTSWSFTTLKNEGSISGVIKDKDGHPVAGATVSLDNGMNATTNDNGEFEIKGVPLGNYILTVSKNGYQDSTRSVTVEAGKTSSVSISDAAKEVSAAPDAGLMVIGLIAVTASVSLVAAVYLRWKKREDGK